MPVLASRSPAPTVVQDDVDLPPFLPDLPDDVLKRFPSLNGWKEDEDAWYSKVYNAIQDNNNWISQSVTKANQASSDLRVSINGNTAAITTETIARIAADEILAQRIVTVSAIAGVASNITIQATPPGTPLVSDYWVNNSDLLNPITYQWNGAAWVEVTDPISVAAVAAEQTARITADGNLSGKFTLTVIAGNVVTGMNITSSSGPGTNISSVIFRATDFQIYNGASGVTMFSVSGATVQLAGTLTVSTSGKVFIGTGTYGNLNTSFYVDSTGQFSLKDKLTWDGTLLSFSAGNLGGSNTVVISSAGLSVGTTGAIMGGQSTYNTGTGFFLGYSAGAYKFSIGDGINNALTWNGTSLGVQATATIATNTSVLITDNNTYRTWQGDAGINLNNFFNQTSGSATGLSLLGVGSGIGTIYIARAGGSYASKTSFAGGDILSISAASYNGATWDLPARIIAGTHSSSADPYAYYGVQTTGGANSNWLITNFDGKVYFCTSTTPMSGFGSPWVLAPWANLYCNSNGELKTDGQLTIAGVLKFGTFNAGAPAATGYVNITDSGGTVRKVLVG